MHDRNQGLVTIILTTLNSERFVARSIESCLSQWYGNLEILVVDGGSQDGTLDIVRGYGDARIRLIHQAKNEGKLPGAINLGMAAARGELITWTQDDCWYEPDAIETMVDYLDDHADVDLVYTDYWEVNEQGERLRYQCVSPPSDILVDDVVRVCFLFRREVYETVGPQDTTYFPVHEVPWRVRVAEQFRLEPLHIPLFHYTVHPRSLTGDIGQRALRRMTARALRAEGYFDERASRRRLAQIDVMEAYERYIEDGSYGAFLRHAVSGIWQDWRLLRNRGLVKLMLMSLVPWRDTYRRRWMEHRATWRARHLASLREGDAKCRT
jgi:glycosyltransferase involved in cell wall biosynthesis